jgi:hypothetical protein
MSDNRPPLGGKASSMLSQVPCKSFAYRGRPVRWLKLQSTSRKSPDEIPLSEEDEEYSRQGSHNGTGTHLVPVYIYVSNGIEVTDGDGLCGRW